MLREEKEGVIVEASEIKGTKQSCFCAECKLGCRHKPGWFLPNEVELVAVYLGVSLKDLFKNKLAVDWWVGEPDIFLLSPSVASESPGIEFSANPLGKCVFFKEDLCEIHPVKPCECREMIHSEENNSLHGQVADAWRSHQNQIVKLLGRTPESADSTISWGYGGCCVLRIGRGGVDSGVDLVCAG